MNRRLLITIFLISCIAGWFAYLFDLDNSYICNDDARLVLLGVIRLFNPDLFQDYLIADYAEAFVTPGVRALYWSFSGLVNLDPIALSKVISFCLFVISATILLKLMYTITSSKISSVLAVLFFISISTYKLGIVGGFPRSFSTLLTLCFLYFLIKRAWMLVFITLVLSTLLNPLTFLLCYGTFVLSSIVVDKKSISIEREKRRTIALIATILFGASILVPQHLLNSSPYIGKTMNRAQATSEAVYYRDGRPGSVHLPTPNVFKATYQHLVNPFTLNSKAKILDREGFSKEKSIITKTFFSFVLLFILINIKRGYKVIPKEIFYYLLSAMSLYVMADLLFIKIYFPQRYLVEIPLISLIIVFSTLSIIFKSIRAQPIFTFIVTFITLIIFLSSDFSPSIGTKSYLYDKPIFDYIESLPQDVVIAAYPMGVADNIPLFTKRKVFIFYEASNPFHVKYWDWVKERTTAFFSAYYADKLVDVNRFLKLNKIDYLIVDSRHFKDNFLKTGKRIYFQPFDRHILEITRNRKSFALSEISPDDRDMNWDNKYIISQKKIENIIKREFDKNER